MTRRPRVLVLTPDYPPARGGIQLLVDRVVSNLSSAETRVVTIGGAEARRWDAARGNGVVRSPRLPSHRTSILGLNALALREAVRFRPDVVLCAHLVAGPAAAAIRRLVGAPTVVYLYAKEVGASPRLASFALRRSTSAIVISGYTKRLALDAGAAPERIRLIPPGVDVTPPPPEPRPRSECPIILTIARLEDRYKGHDLMVRALSLVRARVPDTEWVVIGDGTLRRDIQRLADANHVGHAIRMLGNVSDEERDWWLARANVFAMPSRLPVGRSAGEGFGIVYLEAGLHGVPVVAGDVGGAVDAVVDGVTGLLVDPTSQIAIADAIADLLEDPARADAMGRAGREHALGFAWDAIVPQVEAVLLEAIEAGA